MVSAMIHEVLAITKRDRREDERLKARDGIDFPLASQVEELVDRNHPAWNEQRHDDRERPRRHQPGGGREQIAIDDRDANEARACESPRIRIGREGRREVPCSVSHVSAQRRLPMRRIAMQLPSSR
jgi:hypothetical protein